MHFATLLRTAYSAFVNMYGIFHNIPTMLLSTVTTANWRFTPIHMQEGKDNIGRQCSEIALSRKPFEIGRMYICTFLLRMANTMTSHNIDLSSWDILYKMCLTRILIWPSRLSRTSSVIWFVSLFPDHKIDLLMKCEFVFELQRCYILNSHESHHLLL
jgi:hypothetical protein